MCNAEQHNVRMHPDLQRGEGTGHLYREDQYSPRSYERPVREVDYEFEPHETVPPGYSGANKSAPVDDLEDARNQLINQNNRYVRF